MSIVFDAIPLNGLRKSHLSQLLWYIHLQEISGTYYGNYKQFMKRQEDLQCLLHWACEYAYEEGVVLPKRIEVLNYD
jgi:hypothetical protein